MVKSSMAIKVVATNRKAYHNYYVGESVEAGIALTGSEIKSIRDGRVSLGDAYVRPEDGELWLVNAAHRPLRPEQLHESRADPPAQAAAAPQADQ